MRDRATTTVIKEEKQGEKEAITLRDTGRQDQGKRGGADKILSSLIAE